MTISEELYIFFYAIWAGCLVQLVYEGLGLWRKVVSHKNSMVNVEDFIFWVWASVWIYNSALETCSGEIRWYFVIGIVAGAISLHTIWYRVKKILKYIKNYLKKN